MYQTRGPLKMGIPRLQLGAALIAIRFHQDNLELRSYYASTVLVRSGVSTKSNRFSSAFRHRKASILRDHRPEQRLASYCSICRAYVTLTECPILDSYRLTVPSRCYT